MDPLPDQPVPRRRGPRATGPDAPEPSPGPPLPRRARHAVEPTDDADPTDDGDREPALDPDGRPLRPVDDAMLHRLLSGLREI